MNDSQEEKQKTTTTATISKLSFALLISALLVLSSIAAIQLLGVPSNNAAFAAFDCEETETDGVLEITCTGGEGGILIPEPGGTETFGGGGGHGTCTIDGDIQTCTISEGGARTSHVEGEGDPTVQATGGRHTCTLDQSTGEEVCSGHGVDVNRPPGDEEEGG